MRGSVPLGDYIKDRMFYGIKTGFNEAFVVDSETHNALVGSDPNSGTLFHPVRGGEDCRDYFIRPNTDWLIVVPCVSTRAGMEAAGTLSEAKAWEWFSEKYPGVAAHLWKFAAGARKRQDQGEFWWELRACDYYEVFDQPKIVFPDICKNPRFCFDDSGLYLTNTAYALGTGDKYLLGLLNSRVFWFAIANISIPFGVRAGEYRYRLIYQYMEHVPIRAIDLSNPADKSRHDQIVALVEQMLEAKKQEAAASGQAKEIAARKCAALDRRIDALVYELYGLTAEDIALVEGGSA